MPECNLCLSNIPPNETKCPVCGNPISNGNTSDSELLKIDDKVHALLINANLKKLRGDLEGAIQESIAALRINPDSVEAHSLLGDIYRDQGNLAESERWYKLALDLNPNSTVDKLRLDQLKTLDNISEKNDITIQTHTSPISKNWFIAGILSIIILVLIIILIWPLLHNINNREADKVQVPSIKGVANKTRSSQNSQSKLISVLPVGSEDESTLIKNLNSSSSITALKLHIVNLTSDPRSNSISVTYINQMPDNNNLLNSLIKNCFIISHEAFQLNPLANSITIRSLYNISVNGRQSAQVIFAADMKKDKIMQIDPLSNDINQMTAALENVWYHPSLSTTPGTEKTYPEPAMNNDNKSISP